MSNIIYDVIIIGASKEGIALYKLLHKDRTLKIAVVSPNFHNLKTGSEIAASDRIYHKVAYSTLKRDLLVLTLDDNSLLCGINVVIASGLSFKKCPYDTQSVYYDIKDIKIRTKASPFIVVGNDDRAAVRALMLAKKFNYIYLCYPENELNCSDLLAKELNNSANIALLPHCRIVSCKNEPNGALCSVKLDTLESLKCKGIVCVGDRVANIDKWFNTSIIALDENKLIKVNEFGQTVDGLNIFAIGTCAETSSTMIINRVAQKILGGERV